MQNENIYKILVEESPAPIALYTGREMIIQAANKPMLKIWARDASVIGKTFREVLPELEAQRISKLLDDVYTSGITYIATNERVELIVDGGRQTFYFNFTLRPLKDDEGNVWGIINTAADITELQANELNDQIKQFEFVTGFMPVQLWTAATSGLLDYVNQRTVDYFGTPAENIIGPAWQNFVHPDDFERCIAVWTHSLLTGETYEFEFRLKDKHGKYKWHLARALPFIKDGEIIKWFGTNTDIDDQKQLQRQKDDFLAIASHELKTPVTSIKAYAQVLGAMLTRDGETQKAEMVSRMDAQVNRLTNLIGDLLDVTKINSGKLQFNKSWFDFNQAVKEAVEDLQHTTQKHTLMLDLAKTGRIYSDKDRISQVLTNLITNAIKYSPHTDKIIISTKFENNEVIVCVQDFGIGIADDKKDKVFEQFYRVSGNKQHTFPGLGLGLYISSEIVKREGGRMWVNSVEGKGSTFCFALPSDDSPTKNNE